jgi:hypothetical protein
LKTTFTKPNQSTEKVILSLSPEALANWKEFQQENERQLRPNGDFYALQGWAGKICGFALRIAAILHVAKENGNNEYVISNISMTSALEITTLLTRHAVAAYNLISAEQFIHDAKELLN